MRLRYGQITALLMATLLSGCITQTTQNMVAGGGGGGLVAVPVKAPSPPPQRTPVRTIGASPGQRQRVAFVSSLNPDCSSKGPATIEFLSKPAHGAVAFERTQDFARHASADPIAQCDDRRVPGTAIYYTSEPSFRGNDVFIVNVLFPDGNRSGVPFTMSVQ